MEQNKPMPAKEEAIERAFARYQAALAARRAPLPDSLPPANGQRLPPPQRAG